MQMLLYTNTQKHTFPYYISAGGELFGCKAQVFVDKNSLQNKYTRLINTETHTGVVHLLCSVLTAQKQNST